MLERKTNILNSRLLDLNKEALDDLKISEINVKEKSLSCPGIKTKWLLIFLEEKKFLSKLFTTKTLKLNEYINKHGQQNVPKISTQKEAERQEDILKLDIAIKEQQEVVEFLEGLIKIFSSLNFDLKNIIEIIKIENQ